MLAMSLRMSQGFYKRTLKFGRQRYEFSLANANRLKIGPDYGIMLIAVK